MVFPPYSPQGSEPVAQLLAPDVRAPEALTVAAAALETPPLRRLEDSPLRGRLSAATSLGGSDRLGVKTWLMLVYNG